MDWAVYILRCSDGSYYTGITNALTRRIEQHNSGKGAKYTKGRGPVELVYHEKQIDRSSASCREAEIKKLSKDQKETLIKATSQ
jgi:putative endonuclease